MSPTTEHGQVRPRPGRRRLGTSTGPVLAWAGVVVAAAVVGVAVAFNLVAGLAVAGLVLAFGIFVADPILLVVIVLPGAILIQRVGGASTNLSVADLLVFVGAIVCLFHIDWSAAKNLKRFLAGILWYQAVLVLVVVAHPFRGDVIEWFHRLSYLAGSTLVGWVIATSGRARQAFRLYLWGAAVLAMVALEHSVALHFHPAQWGVYQKNSVGSVMWVAVVIAQMNPPWARIPKVEARVIEVLCLLGLLASQSRQAAILVVLALGAATLRDSHIRGRWKTVVFIGVPALGLTYYSFALAFQNNPQFNSIAIRFGQIGAAVHVWHQSPWLGLGLRFYNLPQYVAVTVPPNSLVDNLASTGVIGSVAFFVMMTMTMRSMSLLPRVYGTLGLVVLMAHYVDGLFDIFWIGTLSIAPFVIAGISLGMADADPTGEHVRDLAEVTAEDRRRPGRGGGTRPPPRDRSPDHPHTRRPVSRAAPGATPPGCAG